MRAFCPATPRCLGESGGAASRARQPRATAGPVSRGRRRRHCGHATARPAGQEGLAVGGHVRRTKNLKKNIRIEEHTVEA